MHNTVLIIHPHSHAKKSTKNASKLRFFSFCWRNWIVWTKFDCVPAETISTMKSNVSTVIDCNCKIFSTKPNIYPRRNNVASSSKAKTKRLIWYPKKNFMHRRQRIFHVSIKHQMMNMPVVWLDWNSNYSRYSFWIWSLDLLGHAVVIAWF